jgi:PKD repeat protein
MRLRAALFGSTILALGVLLAGCFLLQPQAEVDFDASAVEGPQPLVVSFAPLSEEAPVSFAWDFGDGSVSDDPDPVHVYKAAGTYTVSLAVVLADGRVATETKIDYVTVDVSLRKGSSPLLYWVNDRGLLKSGGRGGLGETVVAEQFFSVAAMETVGDKLYWIDHSRQSIYRANLDGSGQETLVHGRELYYLPWDLAVDPVGGKMYWVTLPYDSPVESGDYDWVWVGGIHRADLDGTNVETLVTYPAGASEYATHVAVDPVLGRVYWCLQSGSTWKLRTSPTGSWTPRTVSENGGSPRGLALDTIVPIGARYVYYVVGSKVQRLHIATGAPLDVLAGVELSFDIAVDALEGKLYVATQNGIVRSSVNGSDMEALFPDESVRALVLR